MTRPITTIVNVETQEQIIRELNDEEYAQHLADVAKIAEYEAKVEAKAEAKRQALEALGLSQEVVNLLAE